MIRGLTERAEGISCHLPAEGYRIFVAEIYYYAWYEMNEESGRMGDCYGKTNRIYGI